MQNDRRIVDKVQCKKVKHKIDIIKSTRPVFFRWNRNSFPRTCCPNALVTVHKEVILLKLLPAKLSDDILFNFLSWSSLLQFRLITSAQHLTLWQMLQDIFRYIHKTLPMYLLRYNVSIFFLLYLPFIEMAAFHNEGIRTVKFPKKGLIGQIRWFAFSCKSNSF